MSISRTKRWVLTATAVATSAVVAASPAGAAPAPLPLRGPSTTTNPYVVPVAPGVEIGSLLTVNDAGAAGNGYELVGIPDGLGAFREPDSDVILHVNHELRSDQGIVRRHKQRGAFVSRFVIDQNTLQVREGRDLINPFDGTDGTASQFYNYTTGQYQAAPSPMDTAKGFTAAQSAAFGRFCSASITEFGQLHNTLSGNGTNARIYFANEENGPEGRVFGVLTEGPNTGQAYQLPRLGLFSWENTLAARNLTDTTTVVGLDDATPGEVYVYRGTKTSAGNDFDRAGLTNGRNFGVVVPNVVDDATFRSTFGRGTPARFTLTDIEWDQSGGRQQTESTNENVLKFARPEDGAFDPGNRNDFYFLTTAGGPTRFVNGKPLTGGGLWRMRFDNVDNPTAGGTLTLLLDGSEGAALPDNMDIDENGNILIQEDPGNNDIVARIFAYRIGGPAQLATVAQFDPALFAPGARNFTVDEESSGIIDAQDFLGDGYFLFDAEVHNSTGLRSSQPEDIRGTPQQAEYVENGQLLAMRIPDFASVYRNGQPAPIIPEVPVAIALPVIGIGVLGAAYVLRRRRPEIATVPTA